MGGENSKTQGARYNILHSNVQTLTAATFSKVPKPDVTRRFRDNDPVGRVAALIVERSLEYEIQHYPDYRATLKSDIQDRFLGGRGVAWVRYEPHMKAQDKPDVPVDGVEVSDDIDEPGEELDYECAPLDYVHWRDFGHVVARTWEEVPAVWRWVYLTRAACVERFGPEKGATIPLDATPEELKRQKTTGEQESRAKIAEIWDKEAKKAYWLSQSLGEILDTREQGPGDGELPTYDEFFPCPRPLFATMTNESLVPVPDFTIYQDQANELDVLAQRIDGLIKALKVQGVYDDSQPVIGRLFTEGENAGLLPAKNWQAFAEKNGLKGAIDLVDLDPIARALKESYLAFAQVKGFIDELTGISDIIRGQTEASETATAQRIKSQYASLRLKQYQNDVALYATQLLRLKAQVQCQKFSDESLMMMAAVEQLSAEDQALVPQALQLLRQDALRTFRVEVAADTLIEIDEQTEKENRVEFLKATAEFMMNIGKSLQGIDPRFATAMIPMLMEMLKFGVTGFKVGKTLEGVIDQAADQMKQLAAQPQQPKPDPAMMKVQGDQQAQQQKMQGEQMLEQQRLQAEGQRIQMEEHARQRELFMEAQANAAKAREDAAFARFEALLKAHTALEVAEIGANATISAQQIAGAKDAT